MKEKISMIDFEKIYESLSHELAGNQKRIPLDSVVAVYFGLSSEGYFRLSFMSSIPAPKLESTKTLRIPNPTLHSLSTTRNITVPFPMF